MSLLSPVENKLKIPYFHLYFVIDMSVDGYVIVNAYIHNTVYRLGHNIILTIVFAWLQL